jgi:hypothetical protein
MKPTVYVPFLSLLTQVARRSSHSPSGGYAAPSGNLSSTGPHTGEHSRRELSRDGGNAADPQALP